MAGTIKGDKRPRPGGHHLRREVVVGYQRERILGGAAAAIAAAGYRNVAVSDIVRSAAIARARFYENFASKEDCFLALFETASDRSATVTRHACAELDSDFPTRVKTGIEALLGYLGENPEQARACVVEGPAAGPPFGPFFEAMVARFVEMLQAARSHAELEPLAETVEETVIGGLYWQIYYAILEVGPEGLASQADQLTEFALIPFIGPEAAHGAVS